MIYSSRGIDWWKDLSFTYFRSKIWIFGHFWSKMALLGGQKIEFLNFNWLVLVCNPFRSYNFTIIKLLLKKWKLCYTLLDHPWKNIRFWHLLLATPKINMPLFFNYRPNFQKFEKLIFIIFEKGCFKNCFFYLKMLYINLY